jgi:hypothetical protein
VQIRFFIQVLQQMGKNHPMSGVLSPTSFDKGQQDIFAKPSTALSASASLTIV